MIEYRALLIEYRALSIVYRALWIQYRALWTQYRALWIKFMALLMEYKALWIQYRAYFCGLEYLGVDCTSRFPSQPEELRGRGRMDGWIGGLSLVSVGVRVCVHICECTKIGFFLQKRPSDSFQDTLFSKESPIWSTHAGEGGQLSQGKARGAPNLFQKSVSLRKTQKNWSLFA